jgi:Carboxypeptidase regulatory-like domain
LLLSLITELSKPYMRIVLFFLSLLTAYQVSAQELQQTLRGIIVDKFTKLPIENATISIKEISEKTTATNAQGEFNFQLPLGRYTLLCTKNGLQNYVQSDIILNSSKQVILTIEMEERIKSKLDGITVKGAKSKDKTVNEMSLISTRQFSVEEANRYAGSFGDPARMAQNFAGVQSNGDRRNDIIIRGNSPLGLVWRAEGVEIPNPNHFSGIGTTGGAISILNNNNLSNSDFLTGAFAPQYGNALAGVFDLRLKNGNNQKHERLIQFGFNGLEFGAEGPLSVKNKSSYIVNARYSTLEIFDALKINLGANAIAKYRDITFKFHIPTKKYGTFDIWNVAGYNTTASYSKNFDTNGKKFNPRPKGFDTYFDNWMSASGISHTYTFNKNTNHKLILAFTSLGNATNVDSLYNNESQKFNWLDRIYKDSRYTISYQLNHKWNAQHQTQFGINYTGIIMNISDSIWWNGIQKYVPLLSYTGNTFLGRAFVQHQWKPTDNINVTGGLHGMYFGLNGSNAVEPRLAIKWNINPIIAWSAGYGLHNQLQPFSTYFYNRTGFNNLKDSLTNKNLGLIASHHFVTGIDILPRKNYRIKLEAYYQQIAGAGVETNPSSYSTLNEGAFYYIIPKPFCTNNGKGYNIGTELTIEKFFSNHFYFLATSSLYDSRYLASDDVWRKTAFNGSWTANALGGYEWVMSKNNTITFNLKLAMLGGRMYSPVDIAQSKIFGDTRLDESKDKALSLRYPNYIRPDVKISYRINRKKASHEIGLNIDNFINRQNVQSLEYDNLRNTTGFSYQNGLFPVVQYRVEF